MSVAVQTVTDLWARGYTALPSPRRVALSGGELRLDATWPVVLGKTVATGDVAVTSLAAGLRELHGWDPAQGRKPKGDGEPIPQSIFLDVKAGAAGSAPQHVAAQGYRITVSAERVDVTGNAPQGLFYGVHTLLQLLRRAPAGHFELPLGELEDWPDRELRLLHYDTKHHQDRFETVKALIERAAAFKCNGIAWEIEDKFAYRKHPLIGAPGAFTAEQMQELTKHALKHYVELIPIVQGPSHLAFVLKHEAYAHLREDPNNNYMLCPSNEKTYELLFAMYDELIEATPGAKYFHVGTDEPYFLGDGVECGCRKRKDAIGQGGMMAEFIARCAEYLQKKGRTVMYWGEWPMTAKDMPRLPKGTVNTVFQNPKMGEAYRAQGIRELIYCPTQGDSHFFPEYFSPLKPPTGTMTRLENLFETISFGPARPFDPLGTIIGTWDDSGLNLETFWLGWAAGLSYGWHPGTPAPEEAAAQFMRVFHGPECVRMGEVYRGLDRLARFWTRAWDRAPSKRGPGYKRQWHPRFDRNLAMPHVPDAETLDNRPFFVERYAPLLKEAQDAKKDLARVFDFVMENLGRARRNRYSLEVFASLAYLFRDFIDLLETLANAERKLDEARQAVYTVHFKQAVDHAMAAAQLVKAHVVRRERMYENLCATWEKIRLPRGMADGEKKFVHIQDHTKNHPADWTPDLSYVIKPSRDLDLEGWAERVEGAARTFQKRNPNTGRGWRPDGHFESLGGYTADEEM